MASLNKAFIMGNLGQDPELRYTQSQTPVVTLNIATTESWSRDGQKQENTEWHRVIVWNKQAENCAKFLKKGRAVFVEGKIQTRSWEDKNGQKRYTTEIVASNVQFMPSAQQGGGSYQQDSGYQRQGQGQGVDPFADSQSFPQADSFGGSNNQSSGSASNLDDIPFMRLGEWA